MFTKSLQKGLVGLVLFVANRIRADNEPRRYHNTKELQLGMRALPMIVQVYERSVQTRLLTRDKQFA
jgi:hypothetical protein